MPIVYSAILPHSPILLPTIGKDVADKVSVTSQSFAKVAVELSECTIDTILVITNPDSKGISDTFTIQTGEIVKATFEEFGDFVTQKEIKCDTVLALAIKRGLEEQHILSQFNSDEKLDYSASVPLILLNALGTKIVVIQPPDCSFKTLMTYGEVLQKIIQQSDKRIAVIASGDLSHALTADAPLGLRLEATVVDQDIITLFRSRRMPVRKITSFQKDAALHAGVCGLNAFVLLGGMLHHMNFKPHFQSYEGPLGVGYYIISYTF
ncbi:MAG: class III extradiol dioxygenase subunit B-like domain-containing protein [Patescibacteria group bacterium]